MTQIGEEPAGPQQGEGLPRGSVLAEAAVQHDPIRWDPGGPSLSGPPGQEVPHGVGRRVGRPTHRSPVSADHRGPPFGDGRQEGVVGAPGPIVHHHGTGAECGTGHRLPGRGDRQRHVHPLGHRPDHPGHRLEVPARVVPGSTPLHLEIEQVRTLVDQVPGPPDQVGERPVGGGTRTVHVEDAHHHGPVPDVDVPAPEPEGGGAHGPDATGGAERRSRDGPAPDVRTAGRTTTCGTAVSGGRQAPTSRAGRGTPVGTRGRP